MHFIEWGGLQTFQLIIVLLQAVLVCIGIVGYNKGKNSKK